MKPHLPIRILLVLNILIGVFTFSKYGESWDVNSLMHYAENSLSMYGKLTGERSFSTSFNNDDLALGAYGPAYAMFVEGTQQLFAADQDAPYPLQHLLYFITFQAGVLAFYVLCLRWMNERAAFGATLLFSTQPVLWGHAFINPKDTPFLAFFLLTLLFGFKMVDNLQPITLSKRTLASFAVFWLVPFLVIFFGSGLILAWTESLVRAAAAGETNLISQIASDILTVPPRVYVERYSGFYIQFSFLYLLLSTLVFLFLFYRTSRHSLIPVIFAGVLFGIAVAIRNLGAYAGLIVVGYMLWKHRLNAWLHIIFYGLIALAVVYLVWPYLWIDPIGQLWKSVVTMSSYPWTGTVLFDGNSYSALSLPASYLPVLLGIQLTEPVWVLFIAGLAVAIVGPALSVVERVREKREILILTLIWFFLPLLGFIIARTVLYDNFRQVLFILPPVFFMAGLAFEKIKQPALQSAIIALSVLPGIIGIARLYPYEYIYYNSAIGGVDGAYRRFELDYWATSYHEAAEYVNTIAPEKATIWAEGPEHLFALYARKDLKVYSSYEVERADHYDYVITTTRYDLDQLSFPEAPIIYKITRGDAVLTVVKQP